jgi:hypothetical protein
VPTPVGSALSKARQCTPRMVASFFCCSWAQCEFVHGLMPPSLKHLIGFRRDRREAVFLFVRPSANRRLGQVNAAGRLYVAPVKAEIPPPQSG